MKAPNWLKSQWFWLPVAFVGWMVVGALTTPEASAQQAYTHNPYRPNVCMDGTITLPKGESLLSYHPETFKDRAVLITKAHDGCRVYRWNGTSYDHISTIRETP